MKALDEKKLVEIVEYRVKDALLNLIYDIADDPASETEYIPPKRFSDISDNIRKAYIKLCDVLEATDRSEFESMLDGILAEITECAVNINRYTSYNDMLGQEMLREYKLADISGIGDEVALNNGRVVEIVKEYVHGLEEDFESGFKKSEIVSSLPLRMTRERCSDYIRRGIKLMTAGLPEGFAQSSIERLKDMFFSKCDEDFSADFPLMYEKLNATRESISELDSEALMEAMGDIDGNTQALGEMYDILGIYYNNVMYLSILSLFVVDTDFIFGGDMVLRDLYFAMREMLSSGDESFREEILERAGNEISDRFDKIRPDEEKILKAIDSFTAEEFEALNEDIKMTVNVSNTVNSMFFSELDEHIMLKNGGGDDVDKAIDGLIEYINDVTADMPNSEKKLLKQRFLSRIPSPMSNDELCSYCSYALDGINDRNISLMTYSDIFHIIDEDKDEHEHHHSHDHDHCGHGHAHHHHCGCGHEH